MMKLGSKLLHSQERRQFVRVEGWGASIKHGKEIMCIVHNLFILQLRIT